MEYSDIRVISKCQEQSIIDRAKYIVEKQLLISTCLNKFDWYLFDKTPVDIRQKEQVSQLILKRIKKEIKAHTTIKEVSDDYLDYISTIDGFYASKKFDKDSALTYVVGKGNKKEVLMIKKVLCFEKSSNFNGLRKLVIDLVGFFEVKYIEVSEYAFYSDLMNLELDEYRFGWMTYFSKDIKIPSIPSEIEIEELPDGGKLLVTTKEIFSTENPEHVRKAKLLVDLFRKNNIKC